MTEDDRQAEITALRRRLAELESMAPARTPLVQESVGGVRRRSFLIGAGIITLFLVALALGSRVPASRPLPSNAATPQPAAGAPGTTSAPTAAEAASEPEPEAWTYEVEEDALRDAPSHLGCVVSSGFVALSAPYDVQRPLLCVRKDPRFGVDAFLRLPRGGQFHCLSYEGCTVKVRFDKGAVQTFSANTASDGSPDLLFILNDQRFIAALRRSKVVHVEAEFYRDGVQQMSFPAAGFDPARVGLPG